MSSWIYSCVIYTSSQWEMIPAWYQFDFDSKSTGCWNVSLRYQRSYSGIHSLRWSYSLKIGRNADPPSPHVPWKTAVWILLTATICVVWNSAIKDLWYTGLAVHRSVGYAILISSKRSVTAIHDCHFPSDLAMCRREDLTRPWINAHVLLALISFSPSPGLISSLRLN